jgi:hypothetical protein
MSKPYKSAITDILIGADLYKYGEKAEQFDGTLASDAIFHYHFLCQHAQSMEV